MSATLPPTFKPTLILHGGAVDIHRSTLPPPLYDQFHASLLAYLRSTYTLLKNGATALDAAVHAVSLMEDDELFNCGRGSVFTSAGTIEMEASVMVTSIQEGWENSSEPGTIKTRRGRYQREEQFAPDEWFWTQKRWDEHMRGLKGIKEDITMSQGTVGCVCLDQWGNLAVATSTGGLTNKKPGRVGDTPTFGAGFWAEAWDVKVTAESETGTMVYGTSSSTATHAESDQSAHLTTWDFTRYLKSCLGDCLTSYLRYLSSSRDVPADQDSGSHRPRSPEKQPLLSHQQPRYTKPLTTRRAVALSGTGNGDSFLRVAAARTASSMLRFSPAGSFPSTLAEAVTAIAGQGGELQRSAGRRWEKTSEDKNPGDKLKRGNVVFDFNCGGMFRAWIEEDADGEKGGL
ncbi:putative asparaginase, partial [Paecilomyces variotii]